MTLPDTSIKLLIDWLIVRRLNHILPLTQAYPVPTYPILHRHLPRMQSALTSQFEHLSTKGSQKTAMWYIIDVLHLLCFKVPMKWNFRLPFYFKILRSMILWFVIFEFGLLTSAYEFFLELQSWPIRVKMCDIQRAVKICKLVRLTS